MKIGILIGRIGGVDGVALETEKWIEVFHKMGHEVFTLSGQFQDRKMKSHTETLAPEMSFFSPECFWGQKKAFFFPDNDLEELQEHIHFYSEVICDKILTWSKDKKIDVLISENASALPAHLSMGEGIKRAAEKLDIPIITHDHDFAWERGDRYKSPHDKINNFIEEIFPLRLPNSYHAVINLHGQKTLLERYNRKSVVVPNVMDFGVPYGQLTDHNKLLRKDLGYSKDDILLFQITRIVRRKGIEVAIKLIDKLQDSKVKLVITGSHADDEGSVYFNELNALIFDLGLSKQVVFADHVIKRMQMKQATVGGTYSLGDAYANANSCTYFSTYEGFGNAFVESVLARKPIFVNNYKPVYMPDIGSKGFKTVMLEDNNLTDQSVKDMADIIYNPKLNKEIADYNFDLGKKYFSYDALEEKLTELLEWATK